MSSKSVFCVSDFHLGVNAKETSFEREKRIVQWLEEIAPNCEALILNGDTFDFWYEYKHVIPKGFSRFLGCISQMRDANIPIELLVGNHDLWHKSYFTSEFGIPIYHNSIEREWFGKKVFIAHGDGLGPGDSGYKFLKTIFTNQFCKWAFSRLHPNFAVGLAQYWSKHSRHSQGEDSEAYQGDAKEWLYQFCLEEIQKGNSADFFVFGHRHLPLDKQLPNGSRYINSGDWLWHYTFAELNSSGEMLVKGIEL